MLTHLSTNLCMFFLYLPSDHWKCVGLIRKALVLSGFAVI